MVNGKRKHRNPPRAAQLRKRIKNPGPILLQIRITLFVTPHHRAQGKVS